MTKKKADKLIMNIDMEMDEDDFERQRRQRRARHIEEMKRQKRRQLMIRRISALTVLIVVVGCILIFTVSQVERLSSKEIKQNQQLPIQVDTESIETQIEAKEAWEDQDDQSDQSQDNLQEIEEAEEPIYSAVTTKDTIQPGADIISNHVIVIDEAAKTILAQKASETIICPASMTKILTVLVAAEHVTNLEDTFQITIDITDYSYVHDCSNVGFSKDETVTVRDLFYGTVLPSGADAAVGLATYVAGSQEAFVEMMNEKLEQLGLSETAHFTNCVGIYDENHYCTVYDMAMIMKAAIDNELCREVLSAHTYTTSSTPEHPDGITISNWFLRRIEDKDCGGEVLCGKTGYVVQSGNCAASYALDSTGKGYICVTADATSGWKCIYDHVALYKEFM